jgi:hyperosmotically inducible protein
MIARQTDGVRDVIDQITVNPEAAPTTGALSDEANEAAREAREEGREASEAAKEAGRAVAREGGQAADRAGAVASDATVTAAVKSKLLADTAVSGLKIDVDTNGGVVTLTGTVSTKAEADRAVSLARDTDGVMRVVNNLRIGR